MGVDADSVVLNERQMRARVGWTIEQYQQPALVETYLPGREFVVGVVGNRSSSQRTRHRIDSGDSRFYGADGRRTFPILEIDHDPRRWRRNIQRGSPPPTAPETPDAPIYICPASVATPIEEALKRLAVAAVTAVGALDLGLRQSAFWCRRQALSGRGRHVANPRSAPGQPAHDGAGRWHDLSGSRC